MGPERNRSAVHEFRFRVVRYLRYRKDLPESVQKHAKTGIRTICEARGWQIRAMKMMPDHIRLVVSARPLDMNVAIVKALEGVSAKALFQSHQYLRRAFRKARLWSPSHCIGTVGHLSEERVARYVGDQTLGAQGRPLGRRPASPNRLGGSPGA